MARPLRIEFPGAVYHVTARGNRRQAIVTDDDDRRHLMQCLENVVRRFGWELLAFAIMTNHLHLFFRTPERSLSLGMQTFLSGYVNWFRKRRQRVGHLFAGRFKAAMVEDESYFWEVSRYVHLNPVRTRPPLVDHPRDWPWSSYAGYVRRGERLGFVQYDTLLAAWEGQTGGKDAAGAYRRFVESGMQSRQSNPFRSAFDGWILGSESFVKKLRQRVKQSARGADSPPSRKRLLGLPPSAVLSRTAAFYGVPVTSFSHKRNGDESRAAAAWAARRLTSATLSELAPLFGLGSAGSVTNLTRRVESQISESPQFAKEMDRLCNSIRTE